MCVIAVKPAGIDLPNDNLMEKMWKSNSDGAGIAYTVGDKVYIEKGFMTYKEFENGLAGLEKRIKKTFSKSLEEIPMMFHFRIGTHGPNSPQLTHPFPIAEREDYLTSLELTTDIAMCHNGIIHDITVTGKNMSDTTQYIRDVLVPLKAANSKFHKHVHFKKLMENTISGSRFVFLDKFGDFEFVGDWKVSTEAPGVWFSNLNHEHTYSYYSSDCRTGCDYDYNYYSHKTQDYFKDIYKNSKYELDEFYTTAYTLDEFTYLTSYTNITADGQFKDWEKVKMVKDLKEPVYMDAISGELYFADFDQMTDEYYFTYNYFYEVAFTISEEGLELVTPKDFHPADAIGGWAYER